MRKIDKIIVHCSDSDVSAHDDIKIIDEWHEERGFKSPSGVHCGYHYFITNDGIVQIGRPLKERGAHCKGQNSNSIGICLSGRYSFQKGQFLALKRLIVELRMIFEKDLIVEPHNKYNKKKTCPNFSVVEFMKTVPAYVEPLKEDNDE